MNRCIRCVCAMGVETSPSSDPVDRRNSGVPSRRGARARVARRHSSGAPLRVEYLVGRAVVGYRLFDSDGELELDAGVHRGRRHGREYRLDVPGKLLSATTYKNGLEHGLARQWSDDGRLIGTYRMKNGTGVDLWWQETWQKPRRPYLSEVHFMRNGGRHGFEWWLNQDERSVYQERHWWDGQKHGIEREWDEKGKLRPGFPKFYVKGESVTRRSYQRACVQDPSLPSFRPRDDKPKRTFPAVVDQRLNRPNRIKRGRQQR